MKEEQSSPFPSTSLFFQVKHPWEGETIPPHGICLATVAGLPST